MKKSILVIILAISGFSSIDCAPRQRPDDFGFIYVHGMIGDTLDTFNSRITKLIDFDRDTSVTFVLSESQLDTIFRLMNDIDLFDYPSDFGAQEPSMMPSSTYSFKVRANSQWKIVKWQRGMQAKDEQSNNLRKLVRLVSSYIYNSEEYKKLPECKLVFM